MTKQKTIYICKYCGYETGKWNGKCPSCGEWDALEETAPPLQRTRGAAPVIAAAPQRLRDIAADEGVRVKTDIGELNSVLGGGVVRGSVVLIGGEPGIGKSTLFLQAAESLCSAGTVLYASAEESAQQVKLRSRRLGLAGGVMFVAQTQLEAILAAAEDCDFIVIDSVQTIYLSALASAPGSPSQVRECAQELVRMAKSTGKTVFMIGHVTKEGAIAGPRQLEHLVDTVLYFEGERAGTYRVLRAVKNRFGSTNEIGVFEMTDCGMREVKNPSAAMLSQRDRSVPGACVYCAVEGTRPVLLEAEALVCESSLGNPRRMATGIDYGRMSLIAAVLEKKIGIKLYNQDIFLNVGGGMRISEPALDAAVAAAIVSSLRNKPVRQGSVFLGEISLTGDIRHVSQIEKRLAEAEKMGMERVVMPAQTLRSITKKPKIELVGVKTVSDLLAEIF